MTQTNKEELIYALYEGMTGKSMKNEDHVYRGKYDAGTGTYYCGKEAQIAIKNFDELKRYIQSRYFDCQKIRVNEDGRLLCEAEQDRINAQMEILKKIMDKFEIPVCNFQ